MGSGTASKKVRPRVPLRHGEGGKDHLTSVEGLAALSLDALSSVAYGPEAIVLVLAAAGTSALGLTLPVTLAIAGLLAVLVVSYCQVIAVHPGGGGAHARKGSKRTCSSRSSAWTRSTRPVTITSRWRRSATPGCTWRPGWVASRE